MIARRYGTTPSTLAGLLPGSWAAYQFDYVVALAGIEHEQEIRPGKDVRFGKPRVDPTMGPKAYRDPTPYVTRKMKIPESGVW